MCLCDCWFFEFAFVFIFFLLFSFHFIHCTRSSMWITTTKCIVFDVYSVTTANSKCVCVCVCALVSLFLSLHVCMYVWLRVSFAILFHIHFTLFCLSRLIPCLGYVSTCQHLLVRWSFTKLHCSSKIGAMLDDFSFNKRGIFNMPIVTNEPWLIGPSFMLIRWMMIISNVSELSII